MRRRTATSAAAALAALLLAASAQGALKSEVVEYKQGDTTLEGYVVYDDVAAGRRPGIIVVHEWYGLNDYARSRADQLARLGYVAFAADMYGRGVRAKTQEEAAKLAGALKRNRKLMQDRMSAALEFLRRHPLADPRRIAAMGYCFGGTAALELARSGADVAGVVSFHGNLDTPHPGNGHDIKAKVLVLHGADDPFAPPDQVASFQEEMRRSGADWQMNVYGGAVHGFTNPASGRDRTKGLAYDERADRRSWEAMKIFLLELFGQGSRQGS